MVKISPFGYAVMLVTG